MKRKTVVLLNGKDAYVVSCLIGKDGVDPKSPHSIVMGLRENKVKALGIAVNESGTLSHYVDMDGKPKTCPNAAKRLNIVDVELRRSLGALIAVSKPVPVVSDSGWHKVPFVVHCANCGNDIKGTKRVNGSKAQIFKPNDSTIINKGKNWYCGCTTRPVIPEKYRVVSAKELLDYLQVWYEECLDDSEVSGADVGAFARILRRSYEFVKKAR